MSIDEVERTILIKVEAPFSHSAILQPEIDTFYGSFEHNQRFKEFEGLIKANHRVNYFYIVIFIIFFLDLRSIGIENCRRNMQ